MCVCEGDNDVAFLGMQRPLSEQGHLSYAPTNTSSQTSHFLFSSVGHTADKLDHYLQTAAISVLHTWPSVGMLGGRVGFSGQGGPQISQTVSRTRVE